MQTDNNLEAFRRFVYNAHNGQTRNNGNKPYREHLDNVEAYLTAVIHIGNEVKDNSLLLDMRMAALGHDLIEDTKVSREEILNLSNERTLELIIFLTNPDDDAHTDRYMTQLEEAPEEALLIKYADLLENTTSVIYGAADLGESWIKSFYKPILEKTMTVLTSAKFQKYPRTAAIFSNAIGVQAQVLMTKI